MQYPRCVLDSHYHIQNWNDREGRSIFESIRQYKDGKGFRSVNLCALTSYHHGSQMISGAENNVLLALCKLRFPELYIHGGLIYESFPAPKNTAEGFDPLTQYHELMEIGFDGIKILETKPDQAKLIAKAFTDPFYEPFFAAAETDGTHFIFHVADPLTCWGPQGHYADGRPLPLPYGDGTYPAKEELYSHVLTVLDRHPQLKFTFAHFFFMSDETERLTGIFDRFPNVCVDLTPGVEMYGSFGKNPETTKEFFTKYADRILFGTDSNDCDYHEGNWDIGQQVFDFLTTDKHLDTWGYQFQGIALDDASADNILFKNFLRRVSEVPKPINVQALKAYYEKYKHLIQRHDLIAPIEAELKQYGSI